MVDVKVLSVAAVIVLCVAGVGYMVVSQGTFDKDEAIVVGDSRLTVFGNANGDDYIDENDIKALNKIISGELEETKFADANRDGVIDQKDIEYVRGIIDRTVTHVYVVHTHVGVEEVIKCKYPLSATCVAGFETINIMKNIGAVDKIVCLSGVKGSSLNPKLYSDVSDLPKVGPDVWNVDLEKLSKQNVDSVVTMDALSYLKNQDLVRRAGIDIFRVDAAHPVNSLKGIVTLGFLFDCVEGAKELIAFYDGIAKEITERVKHIKYEDRKTALFVIALNSVDGPKELSPYTQTLENAGGRAIADAEGWGDGILRKKFDEGDEWLLRYQSDFIIHSRNLGAGEIDEAKIYSDHSKYFLKMEAYENDRYYIISSALTPSLRIAFMAQFFYPEIFGKDFAFDYAQEYYDRFMPGITEFDARKDATWFINRASMES